MANVSISESASIDTPKYSASPIKQLPFSPSQFLNSSNISFDVTLASTPVKHAVVQVTTPHKDRIKPVSIQFIIVLL